MSASTPPDRLGCKGGSAGESESEVEASVLFIPLPTIATDVRLGFGPEPLAEITTECSY